MTKLKNCNICQIATFCSDCLQGHSTVECQLFQELVEDERWTLRHNQLQREENQSPLTIVCTNNPRNTRLPLSTAQSWYEYYTRISDKDLSHLQLTSDLRLVSDDPRELADAGFLRYGTRTTTMPLTILAALERLFPDIGDRAAINVHLIGAGTREIERMMVFEEILHLLPSLKQLNLTLVGPDMPKQLVSNNLIMLECCPSCFSQNRTRSASVFHGLYHDFVNTKEYDQPDLTVAFHTGFSQAETEEWMPTIGYLANAKHPTMFTSYNNEEMRQETSILRRLGAQFLQEGEINKWKTVCPQLEPMGSVEKNVFYTNQYWYIILPRST